MLLKKHLWLNLSLLTAISACATHTDTNKPPQSSGINANTPEVASGWQHKNGWHTQKSAVAAANPMATEAGLKILQQGGNALDAAIAVQMVLGLVEPQSSGIGGGHSCFTTTKAVLLLTMAAKPRQQALQKTYSSEPTASPCLLMMPWSAVGPLPRLP